MMVKQSGIRDEIDACFKAGTELYREVSCGCRIIQNENEDLILINRR